MFGTVHSSLLCSVITRSLQGTANDFGRINWEQVASIVNSELVETNRDDGIQPSFTGVDCHKHWRYLAYGEIHNTVEIANDQDPFEHDDDSDEVSE